VFSLLPKFLQVKVRSRSKVVLRDAVVCVVVVVDVVAVAVIKLLEEPLERGPHHHPQRMILRFIRGLKVLAYQVICVGGRQVTPLGWWLLWNLEW
jgi:hypothetical protein